MARVLVGITGGIAAYKACELVRLFVRAGHDVVPLVTPGADRFVRAETFHALARKSDPRTRSVYPHLQRADLLVIAPLTANTLAKLAHGLADNLVAEAALAHDGPILVAPAMNVRMWQHAGDAGERRAAPEPRRRARRAGGGGTRGGRGGYWPYGRAWGDLRAGRGASGGK